MYEANLLGDAKAILKQAEAHGKSIILPTDFVVESGDISVDELGDTLSSQQKILDVGAHSKTLQDLYYIITSSKSVIWNGPLGIFEDQPFSISTLGIAII